LKSIDPPAFRQRVICSLGRSTQIEKAWAFPILLQVRAKNDLRQERPAAGTIRTNGAPRRRMQ